LNQSTHSRVANSTVSSGLHAAVAVAGQAAALDGATAGQRLLRRVQHKACVCRAAYPPAHDAPGVGINDAWNCRFTRSSGQAAAGLLMVV